MKRLNHRYLFILPVVILCFVVGQRPFITNAQQTESPQQSVQQAWKMA